MKTFFSISAIVMSLTSALSAATHVAISVNLADVSAAVAAASRGDTVLVPAGSATWASALALTRGIKLLGSGRDRTTITGNSTLISVTPDSTAIMNEETIRIEGFTLNGNLSALHLIDVEGAGESSTKPFKNLVIGNNCFKNNNTTTSGNGVISLTGQNRGVIYSNLFDRCNVILKLMGNDSLVEWSNGHFPLTYGTADNLFFEDNTIQYSTAYSGEDCGWTESGQGGRLVMRYNTWNMTRATYSELWDIHGFQNWPGNGQTGTMVSEYYGNTVTDFTSYRWLTHRGGWLLFFNNQLSGGGGGGIEVNQYAAGDIGGSGCIEDVPGAAGVFNTEVNNTYVWNDLVNGSEAHMVPGPIGDGGSVSENNGYWNYTASFNGTVGIGRGTSAPTGPCRVGVGYWVASTTIPTVDPAIIQAGVFYKCLTQNVWTAYYRPYTYPHPLVTPQDGGGAPTISLSPASLAFVSTAGSTTSQTGTAVVANYGSTNVLTWTLTDNASWLQVSPASGTTPGSFRISANPAGLTAGSYTGTVTVAAPAASNTPQTVSVTLSITQPVISLSPASLSFSAAPGGPAPAPQTVSVINGGTTGVLSWTQSDNAAWLQVSPASGTTPGTLTVSADPSGLAVGTYASSLTVTAPGAANTPQTLVVSLVVATGPQLIGHYDMTYPDRASLLAAGWDFLARTASGATRNTEQTAGAVVSYDQTQHPGVLRIPADTGDLWANYYNDTRNTLFRDLPSTWTSVRLKLKAFSPSLSSQQAGLAVYQDDDNYAEVYRIYEGANYVGFITEVDQAASVVKFVQGTVSTNLYMRLNRDPATETITGYYALDNTNWITLGSVSRTLTNPRLGIVVGASPSGYPNADVMWAEVYGATAQPMPPQNLRAVP